MEIKKNLVSIPIIVGTSVFLLSLTSGLWIVTTDNSSNKNSNLIAQNLNNNPTNLNIPSIPGDTPIIDTSPTIFISSIPLTVSVFPTDVINNSNQIGFTNFIGIGTSSVSLTSKPNQTSLPSFSNSPKPTVNPSNPRVTGQVSNTPVPTMSIVNPTSTPIPIQAPTNTPAPVYKYRNGTYSMTGSYTTEGGNESMGVQISLNNDKITNVNINVMGTGDSYGYQTDFKNGINSVVVGKTLDSSTSIGIVNGASLTTRFFTTKSIPNIQSQAK